MVERVTDNLLYDQAMNSIYQARGRQMKDQEISINMKRVNRPSDDPVGSTQILRIRNTERNNTQFKDNAAMAVNILNSTDKALESAGEILMRLQELAVGQANAASATPDTRQAIAREVEQLKAQLITIGNSRFGDRFLFSGFQTTTSPFNSQGGYRGDVGLIPFEVKDNYFVPINIPGNMIFNGFGRTPIQPPGQRPPPPTPNVTNGDRKPATDEQRKVENNKNADAAANADKKRDIGTGDRGTDIFRLIERFATALKTNDVWEIQNTLDEWPVAQNQVFMARAKIGATVNAIERSKDDLETEEVENAKLRSELEDADVTKAYSDLQKNEDILKRTLMTSQRLITTNLFDFLK